MEIRKMTSVRQRSKGFAGAIGFSVAAVLLNTLVCAGTAAAQNTSFGEGALANGGSANGNESAFGANALYDEGSSGVGANTAVGQDALYSNNGGNDNTATGAAALESNLGSYNTANGSGALSANYSGWYNTADGFNALSSNASGIGNTADGTNALYKNSANYNTAEGIAAMYHNSSGTSNTANGASALWTNTVGNKNTADGFNALYNSTGSSNIGVGYLAGQNITSGSSNIEIGSAGSGNESNTIRIGSNNHQTATYIAGISNSSPVTGSVVEVTTSGQLGVASSSARYKRDIRDMGGASAGLMRLRPVTFRYKNDPSGTRQYGLVAEEVERVYPELVVHGSDGKVQSVRYLEFTALLLNELQKQTKETRQQLEAKDHQLAAQQREIDALKQQNASVNVLSERLAALEHQVQTASSLGLRSLASK
jgi:trimeric autotransporter adhesin